MATLPLTGRESLLSWGLALVRVFEADVAASLAWVKGNPDAALAIVAGIIVVRVMFALAPDRQYLVARGAEGRLGYAPGFGDAQQAHNRAVLNALKAQHVAELATRFAANKGILIELAAAIAEKKSMTRHEIASYLVRVVRP